MLKFALKRLLIMLVMLIGLSLIVFVILELPPGDFAERYVFDLRQSGAQITFDQIDNYRHMLGLDRPWPVRYLQWIGGIVTRLDFGWSLTYRIPVTEVLGSRILFTVVLSVVTIALSYLIAIPLGIYSAMHQYSFGDYVFTVLGYLGMATPAFLFALILLYISTMYLNTSVGGIFSGEYQQAAWSWGKLFDFFKHMWIPVLVLGTSGAASTIRTMRATMLDEKNQLYVTVARAKGVSEKNLIQKYPVRAALNPVVSHYRLGIGFNRLRLTNYSYCSGITRYRTSFSKSFTQSGYIFVRYSPINIFDSLTIIGTFLSDILLAALDPRIRFGGGAR